MTGVCWSCMGRRVVSTLGLALGIGWAGSSLAQPTASPTGIEQEVRTLASPLRCDRLSIDEGLPNSHVRAVAQDQRGFMWFGTHDGLARYDGINVRVYRRSDRDPKSISSGYITALTLDADGKLWVGTAEDGANLYDPQTDTFVRFGRGKGGLSSEGVTAIARDRKDRIWLAMSGGGLNRYDATTRSFVELAAKPLNIGITALDVDAAGNLWLGTASDGVIRWNPDSGESVSYRGDLGDNIDLGAVPITAIRVASTGRVWIGSDGDGAVILDPAKGTFSAMRSVRGDPTTLTDDHVSAIFEDRDKTMWVGTANGLNRIDASGRLMRYEHDPNDDTSLHSPGVESVFQDAGGVMWVGGFTAGICKFVEHRLAFGFHRTRTHANSFHEDADGTLWIGTYNDGLYRLERRSRRMTVYRQLGNLEDGGIALDSAWITAIERDRRGTLWVSLKGHGLVAFDTKAGTLRRYVSDEETANALPADTVFDLWEDPDGMLWLATWGAGLVRFDPQHDAFTAYTADGNEDNVGISSNHLYTLYPDPSEKHILWLGTAKGGLVRFDTKSGAATNFRHSEEPTSLSSDDVLTIYREPTGILWVGTFGGGLNRLDPATGKAERFTTATSELTNDAVLGILPDDTGTLWMSTNGGGLVHFDPKTRKFLSYDRADGAQDNEFSQGSFMRSASGELFFGGVNGFNAFFPKNIKRDTYVPPVVLTAFKILNQEVKANRPIWTLPAVEVSYSDSIEIQFAALSYAAPHKNRYAYKLEGFDDKFIETDRPFATYTKLDGGNYTLRVRAANQHGVWNEAGIALPLAVTPPFWRTWQAYFVYLLALGGLVFMVFRIQRQRVRRAEREGRLAVVERDLALTGAVQTGFLPEHNEIVTPKFQLFGLYRPADACGGDWWWYESLSGGRHLVLIGDVTGHGPGPAMVTAAVATAFRVLVENGLDDVETALALLNKEVLRVAKGKYHMTMAAIEIDEATGHWVFHNAGAPPLLTVSTNGKHRVHFCPGAPLGTETGFETGHTEGDLQPTDRILLYTDGIPEIAAPNGAVFGMRRFAQLFERTRSQSLRDAAATLLQHADQTQAGQPQADDWTFTILQWG